MELQELDNQKMKTMQDIAEGNVMLSSLSAEIAKLEEDREDFFKLRENELLQRLDKTLDDSQEIVTQVLSNYKTVREFFEALKSFADFIKEGQTQLEEDIKSFNTQSQEIVTRLDGRDARIKHELQQLEGQERYIKNEWEKLEKERADLVNERRKLTSDQDTIKRTLERLNR